MLPVSFGKSLKSYGACYLIDRYIKEELICYLIHRNKKKIYFENL